MLAVRSIAVLIGALQLGCSDDPPGDADAAMCSCPAAEPPLAGRIVEVSQTAPIPAGASGMAVAICPDGGTLLGGGCFVDAIGPGPGLLALFEAARRFDGPNYSCGWTSTKVTDSIGKATAICLLPAP